jgi:hypothetical protein
VRFAAITLCVASHGVVDFVIDTVRRLLDTPSYVPHPVSTIKFLLIISVSLAAKQKVKIRPILFLYK